jgi:hypothetical protein
VRELRIRFPWRFSNDICGAWSALGPIPTSSLPCRGWAQTPIDLTHIYLVATKGNKVKRNVRRHLKGVGIALLAVSMGMLALPAISQAMVAGAGFTTFDTTVLGCNDGAHPNGIDCNNYSTKDSVYMSGGPSAAGLSNGDYYFSVLVPGTQNGGFIDGADGNLSDTTAGATVGDLGSGDDVSNRTFTVTDHEVTYGGTHLKGTSPNDRAIVALSPYDDTSNAGGVYILAICQVGATSSSQCKYDAFRIQTSGTIVNFGSISGEKYYDANANGILDNNEAGISGWQISLTDSVNETLTTDASGNFSATNLVQDDYNLVEQQATNTKCVIEIISGVSTLVCSPAWIQSGNVTSQAVSENNDSTTVLSNFAYTVSLADQDNVSGINFGNVCVGAGGGLTLGFWSNKNGQKLFGSDDLALMVSLNLRNAKGANFDPTSYTQFRSWLLGAKATNMAYMLSAQMAAMQLNVLNGNVAGSSLVYAPGTPGANSSGFNTISVLMDAGNTELGLHGLTLSGSPYRAYQETLKTALDRANNNLNFVQAGSANCPIPTF